MSERNLNLPDAPEPVAQSKPGSVPLWLMGALSAFLFYGCYYSDESGGGLSPLVVGPFRSEKELEGLRPYDPDIDWIKKGGAVFNNNCAACHQGSGGGVPGQFPPVAGSDWVVGVGPERIIRIVLNGLKGPIKVNGVEYNNNMTPWKDTLKDEQIAQVVSYVRRSWGNKASLVTTDQVKAIRKASAAKGDDQWTADELLKIPHGEEPKQK